MKKILTSVLLASVYLSASATPLFLVRPNISLPSTLASGSLGTAVYQVTNSTRTPFPSMRILTNGPGTGLSANTNSVGGFQSQYCANPFSLTPGASCLIKVQANTLMMDNVMGGPIVCNGVYCSQPASVEQFNTLITQGPVPTDCTSNIANYNSELSQSLDATDGTVGWGPNRQSLSVAPGLSSCYATTSPTAAQITWEQKRIVAAADFWVSQKLNYCHHYNPDWSTPTSSRNAGGTDGGYCNPAPVVTDAAIDPFYTVNGSLLYPYTQQGNGSTLVRWNYSGKGSETPTNWANNNQMWYGMDCSNYTAFLYNFALGIPFDSKTNFQAGQASNGSQDSVSPNTQGTGGVLANTDAAGLLVCMDGTAVANGVNMCAAHGGYVSDISAAGTPGPNITPAQLATALQPGDILFIAGGGDDPPAASSSIVTHAVLWLGKKAGSAQYGTTGTDYIDSSIIAPNDIPGAGGGCTIYSVWGPHPNPADPAYPSWVISDSHYQGADYRVLTGCFYLNSGHLWGVRRVIHS